MRNTPHLATRTFLHNNFTLGSSQKCATDRIKIVEVSQTNIWCDSESASCKTGFQTVMSSQFARDKIVNRIFESFFWSPVLLLKEWDEIDFEEFPDRRQNVSISPGDICLQTPGPSGVYCHVSNWPVWELTQLREREQQLPDSGVKPPVIVLAERNPGKWNCLYLQNEGCDVWSIGTQIWYCVQFVVIELPVEGRKQK